MVFELGSSDPAQIPVASTRQLFALSKSATTY